MGAVDLVIQVESPGAVASRPAAHRPGRPPGRRASRGKIFPKHRGDLVEAAVVVAAHARRPHRGHPLPPQPARRARPADRGHGAPRRVDGRRSRRAWCAGRADFADLSDEVLSRVLDLLVRPLPVRGVRRAAPAHRVGSRGRSGRAAATGAQRLAVTSGGTIPDRGLFGVFLPDGTRVGELDEEMVYESRPGETFLLGAVDVADRGHHLRAGHRHAGAGAAGQDAVLARRRPGPPARARPGRRRVRARACARPTRPSPPSACTRADGLDDLGRRQPRAVPRRAGRGHRRGARRPHHRGRALPRRDRRLAGVRALAVRPPGARAVGHGGRAPAGRALGHRRRDDVERRRHRDPPARGGRRAPRRRAADRSRARSTSSWSPSCRTTALFASRFRECAARALLLPRRRPDSRTPLWQQRQTRRRSAGGRGEVPVVPDPARGHPRVPQRRVRRAGAAAGAERPAEPAHPGGAGRHPEGVAVRPVAAVRLDRRVHVRGRRAAGRAAGGGAGARPRPAARPARRRGAARADRSRGARRPRARAAAPRRPPAGPHGRRAARHAASPR